MATELQQMIDVVAKDKGIDPSIVIGAIEDAYLAASRKVFKGDEDLRSRFNLDTGLVELYAVRLIVADVTSPAREISLGEAQELYGAEAEVGMEIEFPKETEKLGRIAAQTAKQVIAQRVREAEREKIHGEFSQRIGEVVTAMVKRFESGDIIAEIGRIEAQIPRKEQSRAENYAIGDRLRAVIKAVSKNAKGPQVILSRTDPALLVKLFEQEVPEIYDGTVDDPRRRPRSGRPRQGRRVLPRTGCRPRRRVRRHAGHARAGDHPRAPRREDRYCRVVRGLRDLRDQGPQPAPRSSA